MSFIFLLFSFLLPFSWSKSIDDYVGLTKPLQQITKKVGKSRNANRKDIVQNCWLYKNFAIIEVNDPGNRGAIDMSIRPRTPEQSPQAICAQNYKGKNKTLEHMGGYFIGVAGDIVFVDDADAFGGEMAFQALSAKTGKELFRSIRNTNEKLLVRVGKFVGIRYTKALQVDCPLLEEGKNCWKYILAANKIPDSNKIRMPDCRKPFEAMGATPDIRPQLAAWVRVKDLKKPEITYLGGFIKCQPSP